MDCNITVRTVD